MKLRLLYFLFTTVLLNSCIIEDEYIEPVRYIPLIHEISFYVNYADHVTVKLNEDNFATVGSTKSSGFYYDFVQVRKYDAQGNNLWTTTNNALTHYTYRDICADDSGNIFITGWVEESNTNGVYIQKLNSQGTEIWSNTYFLNSVQYTPERITATEDGGIYLAAYNATFGQNRHYLAKISADGEFLWNKEIFSNQTTLEIELMPDGGCVVAASNETNDLTKLYRYDVDGNMLVATNATVPFFNYADELKVDQSGNIYLMCNEYSNSANSYVTNEFTIFKYSPDLSKIWEYDYSSNFAHLNYGSIAIDENNNVYVSKNIYQYNVTYGTPIPQVLKLKQNGELDWTFTFNEFYEPIVPYHTSLIENEQKINVMLGINEREVKLFQINTDGTVVNE